jgi:hypothetical protein
VFTSEGTLPDNTPTGEDVLVRKLFCVLGWGCRLSALIIEDSAIERTIPGSSVVRKPAQIQYITMKE